MVASTLKFIWMDAKEIMCEANKLTLYMTLFRGTYLDRIEWEIHKVR